MNFIKTLFNKFVALGILFIVLLLLPMAWPVIILIMLLSSIGAFGMDDKDMK
jgi:hypothetical protein